VSLYSRPRNACALIDAGDLADLDDTERLQTMLTRTGAR
jgi:hypothetical protein